MSTGGELHVVGIDFGTLSGRAVVVRVADGAELGSAVHEYESAVMDDVLPRVGRAAAAGLGAAGPRRLRRACSAPPCPAALRPPGSTPGRSSASAPTSPRARRCRCSPTARRCAALDELRERPHAYVKLWKHHAAQAHADRITRPGGGARRVVAAALRRAHLLRVAVRQGAAGARGGPGGLRPHGPLDRGGGLDRLAALRRGDAQRLHRGLQGDPPGRGLSVAASTSPRSTRASPTSWATSSSTRCRSSARARAR